MKKRSGFIFLVILIYLVISGCTQIPGNISSNFKIPGQKVITESKGLTIQFKEGQPPLDVIYAGKTFNVKLDIINKDLTEISGSITLSDTPSDEYSTLKGKEEQSFSLQPAEQIENRIIPSKETVSFGPFSYEESKVFKGMFTNFITEIITNHKNQLTTQICINSASSDQLKCQNKETLTNLGNQAKYSPVTITKIEKTVIPQEEDLLNLNLKIYIKNTAKGIINNEDQSIESFNVDMQGASNFDCTSSKKISLKEGEKIIYCNGEITLSDQVFIQNILEISYEYPYKIIETLGPIKVEKLEI